MNVIKFGFKTKSCQSKNKTKFIPIQTLILLIKILNVKKNFKSFLENIEKIK